MKLKENLFSLLRTKEIIAILDGDKSLGDFPLSNTDLIQVKMPYLSGPNLCELSTTFGLPITYAWGGSNLSRWQYMDNLLEHCIKNESCSDLLSHLFSKNRFIDTIGDNTPAIIDESYNLIIKEVIGRINGILYFGGHELANLGNRLIIRKIGQKIEVQAPKIKAIDRDYIKSISLRALEDINQQNFDSAITKSRTLLEEVFCYLIEKKNDIPSTSGNMSELYKQVKSHYNMHTDSNADKRINMLLSGFEKIISSISEMRNKDSDSHGVGSARINIEEHHARLFINAAVSMADFLLSVEIKANNNLNK